MNLKNQLTSNLPLEKAAPSSAKHSNTANELMIFFTGLCYVDRLAVGLVMIIERKLYNIYRKIID